MALTKIILVLYASKKHIMFFLFFLIHLMHYMFKIPGLAYIFVQNSRYLGTFPNMFKIPAFIYVFVQNSRHIPGYFQTWYKTWTFQVLQNVGLSIRLTIFLNTLLDNVILFNKYLPLLVWTRLFFEAAFHLHTIAWLV